MKRLNILLVTMLFSVSFGWTQTKTDWDDLKCEFKEEWSDEYQAVYVIPEFSDDVLKLDSTKVLVEGLLTPVDIANDYYIIGQESVDLGCCGLNTQPDQMMECQLERTPKNSGFGKRYLFEGTLILNADDINQLNYILKDA